MLAYDYIGITKMFNKQEIYIKCVHIKKKIHYICHNIFYILKYLRLAEILQRAARGDHTVGNSVHYFS